MNFKIYKYTNNVNGKVYIGQTKCTLKERAQSGGRNYRECRKFYNAIQKYGWNSFSGEILVDGLTADEANRLERFYIMQYRSTEDEFGYNISLGGDQHEMSDESRLLISKKAKQRYQDPSKNPMYGRTHSDEVREHMSEIKRGASNPMFGKHWTEKQRLMCCTKGKRLNLSAERLSKMSEWAKELGHNNAKKIRCIEEDIIFPSLAEAAQHYRVNPATLCGQLNGRQKTCRGKHFEYVS